MRLAYERRALLPHRPTLCFQSVGERKKSDEVYFAYADYAMHWSHYQGEALFQTHENLEHLAMMERVLGPLPSHMSKKQTDMQRNMRERVGWIGLRAQPQEKA
ncbi:hypothetical protein Tco_0469725 [Tanacetum coccineum]